jgi:hypothetical protein
MSFLPCLAKVSTSLSNKGSQPTALIPYLLEASATNEEAPEGQSSIDLYFSMRQYPLCQTSLDILIKYARKMQSCLFESD